MKDCRNCQHCKPGGTREWPVLRCVKLVRVISNPDKRTAWYAKDRLTMTQAMTQEDLVCAAMAEDCNEYKEKLQ